MRLGMMLDMRCVPSVYGVLFSLEASAWPSERWAPNLNVRIVTETTHADHPTAAHIGTYVPI